MARVPRPAVKLRPKTKSQKEAGGLSPETERRQAVGPGLYHPEIHRSPNRSHGVGPFIKAYAIEGVMEFAFNFSMKSLDESHSTTPGMRRTKTLPYSSPFDGTPHFVAVNSFSGKFVKDTGELVDRPLGAFEVGVWIKEPGTLACAVRLSDKNSDDPVEITVRGVLVFFH